MYKRIFKAIKNPIYTFQYIIHRGNFNSMPDDEYLKLVFKPKMGYKLNLRNPQTFNEKLQWLKLYDRKPEYTKMVDKYEAKKYVAEKISEEYIIPTIGVWDEFEEIDFDILPNQFVLKSTHDSGSIIIVRNKSMLDIKESKKIINRSLKTNYFWEGREWPYKNVKPRIIAEKYMKDNDEKDLIDYKFYCFDGKVEFLYISQGMDNHETARISFLKTDWEFAPFKRSDYKSFEKLPEKPSQYEKMLDIAENLSKNIPFLRVDLYQIQNQVYFSELTFTPCSGHMPFVPAEWDEKMGKLIKIPSNI